jgi:hypothetical protein
MGKYRQKNFWDNSINPITGWRVLVTDELINSRKLREERRIFKSLKSYGNNN